MQLCICCQQLPLCVFARHGHMDMPKLKVDDVKRRVMTVCGNFEKIDMEEVSSK